MFGIIHRKIKSTIKYFHFKIGICLLSFGMVLITRCLIVNYKINSRAMTNKLGGGARVWSKPNGGVISKFWDPVV
jgi:hypothetical protein